MSDDVLVLLTETIATGAHIHYYVDRMGRMWYCGDQQGANPARVTLSLLCKLTGLTEQMIKGKYNSWIEHDVVDEGYMGGEWCDA